MNKKQLQSEQTRKRIADAARHLFVQKGYKATSIEDITDATGSSKGNIYYHFKSKEGLFLYLLDEWDRDWIAKWQEKEHLYTSITEKMYGFAEQMVREDLNHPLTKAADEFFVGGDKTCEVEDRLAEMVESHLAFNRGLIQQGIDSGEFKPGAAEGLAVVLEALVIGLSQVSRRISLEQALDTYRLAIEVFLYGIAGRPET
ncbi:TetR/AcrR family transcriptional regulator [Saccharibacillus alkalitolerans]|uniref:TetR/AcrR family transcriptional regulator n=1 Tax=Saccharibacillus alkalitolerans TaxID=2705290 RepID=A0ABX0F4J0_9BACL|nr:TetR/AcrR family transcriptional regulator [Saccharibacillus alkalitolerans]NGZ75283.1 TetR/AcrR family transcriptional regulator [Saccharibacillus alkalitolerans]